MTGLQAIKPTSSSGATHSGRAFLFELSGGRIHSMKPDGSDRQTSVTDCHNRDGIIVDTEAGHILSLPQLQNRLRAQREWLWSYFTGHAARA